MPPKMRTVLIVDNHAVVREGVRAILARKRRYRICGEAANGVEAITLTRRLRPHIIVMDISMEPMDGLEATRQIVKLAPRTRILILTLHESQQVVREVLKAGAHGYVLKSDADQDLLFGVDALAQGGTYFTTKVAQMVLGTAKPAAHPDGPPPLSRRQREVLELLASGKSNKEAAAELGISVKTVETHRQATMHKLHFTSFSDLVRYAIRERIIEP